MIKKILLISGLLCCCLSLKAQVTITAADLPSGGDTLRFSSVNIAGANVDNQLNLSGASRRWDFSRLQPSGQEVESWKNSLGTPYAFYFFNKLGLKTQDTLNLGIVSLTDIYTFYTKSSTVLKAEGIGYKVSGAPLSSNYSNDDEIYRLPLQFGNRDSNTYHFELSVPGGFFPVSYVQSGTRYNFVDGYGKVVTPYDSFNCIRIKTIIDAVDTIKTGLIPIPVPSKRIEYRWLAPGQKFPVMEITGTEIMGNFTLSGIRYKDRYRTIVPPVNPLAPRVSITITPNTVIAGKDTVYLKGNVTNFATSTEWSITPAIGFTVVGGTNLQQNNAKVLFQDPGLYSVKFEASNPFGSADTACTDCILVSPASGFTEKGAFVSRTYPNPASQQLFFPEHMKTATLMDVSGKIVLVSTEKEWAVQGFARGYYLLLWEDTNGQVHQEQILLVP